MTSDHIPSKADMEALISAGKGTKDLIAHYGVCRKTIENWRKRNGITMRASLGGQPKRLRYETMDRLLKQGLLTREIAERCQCSIMAVSRRRDRKDRRRRIGGNDDTSMPLIPPADRLDLALKAKARALGQPMAWMRGTWLQGQAGRNFMAQGGYL